MNLKSFLKLVEIRTKTASMIPLFLGTLYAVYHFERFNVLNFVIFLVSVLAIDMATTGLNNYFDYKRAHKMEGYNYLEHNAIVRDRLSEGSVFAVIAALILTAVTSGILLSFYAGFVVLFLGAMSFAIGILYSFGPFPISRTPFGELFSGFFMGFVLTFLACYMHISDLGIYSISLNHWKAAVNIDILELIKIFAVSLPLVTGIANIMLANNICDTEEDLENRRYTLPNYIGERYSLILFRWLYYAGYAGIIAALALQALSWVSLTALFTLVPVNSNIRRLINNPDKKKTFSLSVVNFVMINGSLILLIGISIIGRIFFK